MRSALESLQLQRRSLLEKLADVMSPEAASTGAALCTNMESEALELHRYQVCMLSVCWSRNPP